MQNENFFFREMLRLILTTNYTNRRIGEICHKSHNTVSAYRKKLRQLKKDWSELKKNDDELLKALLTQSKPRQEDKRMPNFDDFHRKLQEKHQTQQQLWEEYYELDPETAYSRSQINHYYRKYKKKLKISMRQQYYPGEVVSVDYAGSTISYKDIRTGLELKAQIFIAHMHNSGLIFAWASRSQKLEDWIEAHNKMFWFYGGVPETIICDNLKSAVTKPGKPAQVNRTYAEMARHFNCVVLPTRITRPQDKSHVELSVRQFSRYIIVKLRHMTFFSVQEMNQAIQKLLPSLNSRPYKKGPSRMKRFVEFDKKALRPLPEEPFEFSRWIPEREVPCDFHLKVEGHDYSLPFHLRGEKVETKYNHRKVEFYLNSQCVAHHIRSFEKEGFTTLKCHQPKSYQLYGFNKQDVLEWANTIGPTAKKIILSHYRDYRDYSKVPHDACSNLRKLVSEENLELFEQACGYGLEYGRIDATNIERIMKYQPFLDDSSEQRYIPDHNNTRGPQHYQQGGIQ